MHLFFTRLICDVLGKGLKYESGTIAEKLDFTYSTLMTLLGRDIGGASFDIVIKICRKLEMDPLELTRDKDQK